MDPTRQCTRHTCRRQQSAQVSGTCIGQGEECCCTKRPRDYEVVRLQCRTPIAKSAQEQGLQILGGRSLMLCFGLWLLHLRGPLFPAVFDGSSTPKDPASAKLILCKHLRQEQLHSNAFCNVLASGQASLPLTWTWAAIAECSKTCSAWLGTTHCAVPGAGKTMAYDSFHEKQRFGWP